MYYCMTEQEAMYMDMYHGQFSKKLAEWAINNMKISDGYNLKPIASHTLQEVEDTLKKYNIPVKDEYIYTAWYLYNMACADYNKSLPNKEAIALFVDETINDPDCKPEAVLACFRAKMDVMGIPIHWERYM